MDYDGSEMSELYRNWQLGRRRDARSGAHSCWRVGRCRERRGGRREGDRTVDVEQVAAVVNFEEVADAKTLALWRFASEMHSPTISVATQP